jgi:hypothetical protein
VAQIYPKNNTKNMAFKNPFCREGLASFLPNLIALIE